MTGFVSYSRNTEPLFFQFAYFSPGTGKIRVNHTRKNASLDPHLLRDLDLEHTPVHAKKSAKNHPAKRRTQRVTGRQIGRCHTVQVGTVGTRDPDIHVGE
jgi:hypothetical protein